MSCQVFKDGNGVKVVNTVTDDVKSFNPFKSSIHIKRKSNLLEFTIWENAKHEVFIGTFENIIDLDGNFFPNETRCLTYLHSVVYPSFSSSPGNPGATSAIVFTTTGSTFSPLIEVNDGAEILWTFADGTTSTESNPTVNYGSDAEREAQLSVTPWSALIGINVGYAHDDDGSTDIPDNEQQNVRLITGLGNVRNSLEYICASRNPIETLSFIGFTELHTIECYSCDNLENVNVANTPALVRICVEHSAVNEIDIRQSLLIEDVRASVTGLSMLLLPENASELWHFCAWGNRNGLIEPYDLTGKPNIRDLYVWNNNMSGIFAPDSNSLRMCSAYDNNFTGAVILGNPHMHTLLLNNNPNLSSIQLGLCPILGNVNVQQTALNSEQLNTLVQTLVNNSSANNGTLLTGNFSAITNLEGLQSLFDRGWTIDGHTEIQGTISYDVPVTRTGEEMQVNVGTIDADQQVVINWGDGNTETFDLAQMDNQSTAQPLAHTYADEGEHTAIVTLNDRITYFGVPQSSGYSGDLNNLGNISQLYYVQLFGNSFAFMPTLWNQLGSVRQWHLMSNSFTQDQIDALWIALNQAYTTATSGVTLYSPGNPSSAEAIAARTELMTKI